jgi:hypothetical protein
MKPPWQWIAAPFTSNADLISTWFQASLIISVPRIGSLPDQVVVGRVIPGAAIGLQKPAHLLVDFPTDQQLLPSRPGIEGDGRLFGGIEGRQLVFTQFDRDGISFPRILTALV